MEMAGIVCLTGAKIIQLARSRIEQIGRPLELDTDGIWCIFPSTFPSNFDLKLVNGKSYNISYPCVMLNHLVHDQFTNHQYQELSDPSTNTYSIRSENSIFFEVDGPYLAMILPASKEADKLLKKRYAVFNFDKSIAELKGFELKRRGELKLIKIFQSALFDLFLEGTTLQECYDSVARLADKWLDILYSKGADLDDEELFDLISENRSMSKSLEEYGAQKSTSISTAKRLAEFLGDQMVKDRGLNCKFIISQKPAGLPVSERAIPLAIFQAEPTIKKHFLRKWLKDSSLAEFDIRSILDWQYYLERFSSVVQKLITIPAAMQKIRNPVPRIQHPDWLLKRTSSTDSKTHQTQISDIFKPLIKSLDDIDNHNLDDDDSENEEEVKAVKKVKDMEDFGESEKPNFGVRPLVSKRKIITPDTDIDLIQSQPSFEEDYAGWLAAQKVKWARQKIDRDHARSLGVRRIRSTEMSGVQSYFLQENIVILSQKWDVIQIVETEIPGNFRIWAMINQNMHSFKLQVPRILYINCVNEDETFVRETAGMTGERCPSSYTLPRTHPTLFLYKLTMSERTYQDNLTSLGSIFSRKEVEGVYEAQVPLLFRALINVGASVSIVKDQKRKIEDGFKLSDLIHEPLQKSSPYLSNKSIAYFIIIHSKSGSRHVYSLFSSLTQKITVIYVDPGKNEDQVPNLQKVYAERFKGFAECDVEDGEPRLFNYSESVDFQNYVVATDAEAKSRVNIVLRDYKDTRKGPCILIVGSSVPIVHLMDGIPFIKDYPYKVIPYPNPLREFPALGWQTQIVRKIMTVYFTVEKWIRSEINLSNYTDVPLCNMHSDWAISYMDLLFARELVKKDMVLWYSVSERPDLGGRQEDSTQPNLIDESEYEINNPGCFGNITLDLSVENLAFNTIIQAAMVNELEGSTSVIGFEGKTMDAHLKGDDAITSSSDYNQLNYATFRLIRDLIKMWYSNVTKSQGPFDTTMLNGFYRWLTNTSAKLHEPALLELIHGLMKKVFFQLVAQVRKMGCEIIYANFERIVANTSKKTLAKAIPFSGFLIDTIKNRNVLMMLGVRVSMVWEHVNWLDVYNHGGFFYASLDQDHEQWLIDVKEGEASRHKMMLFNIAEYLPPRCKELFIQTIDDFLEEINGFDEENHETITRIGGKNTDEVTPKTSFLRNFIKHTLKKGLLKNIQEIQMEWVKVKEDMDDIENIDANEFRFPILPGSHLNLDNPILELIKYICQVIGLDKNLEWEVGILKRDLLNVIGIKQFNTVAEYKNPCEKFVLPHIVCRYCCFTKDLDLTRELQNDGESSLWNCDHCGNEYDKTLVEHRLVSIVQKRLQDWHLQDLQCERCRNISCFSLRARCTCSGNLNVEKNLADSIKKLTVLKNISEYYEFELLKECTYLALEIEVE